MKLKPFKRIPVLIAFGVIVSVCLLRLAQPTFVERLEWLTFDFRAREALRFSAPAAPNLGFIYIDEESLKRVQDRSLGFHFGLHWPRQVYGRLVHELAEQGAHTVALDVLFGELRDDHPSVQMTDGSYLEDDDYFALELGRASNVVLAVTAEVVPPPLFATNAAALGEILADKDGDGVLRRARAFGIYRKWHPAFLQAAADAAYGIDLQAARLEPGRLVLPRSDGSTINIPLDAEGNFAVADLAGDKLPPGMAPRARPFAEQRIWHLGIVLAARQLGLDLARAEVELDRGRITLRGPGGITRVLPVDAEGYFYIDWCLPPDAPQLTLESIQSVLRQARRRLEGETNGLVNRWGGKLAVVGSAAALGNDLTDRGTTPLRADTLLVSKHWNVANSILTDRFVRRTPLGVDLGLIVLMGALAAVATWQLRTLFASLVVGLLFVTFAVAAVALYLRTRYWVPMVLPLVCADLATHVCLVTWRAVFEQADKRRVKSIFSTIVSPRVMQELLQAETLSLGGARREVTVFFADVRGFTEFTDASQEQAARFVAENRLSGAEAEACFDQRAREAFDTVNLYLGRVANSVIEADGILDKFIGDCVMAFWGAPAPHPQHALAGVGAAIQAQRAIAELNRQRAAENRRRQAERGAGSIPADLPLLVLGIGLNTGMAAVGLMGAQAQSGVRQGNYTVFGCEVNLASRLESLSGRSRILISQATFEHLQRDAPALAAACLALPPVTVKGIRAAVQVYEVPWRLADDEPQAAAQAAPQPATA